MYYLNGTVTVGIYAYKTGIGWTKVADHNVFVFQNYSSGGQKTAFWSEVLDINLGSGIEHFGISIESHSGVSAQLLDFISAEWSATASSGERSATPNGQTSTATVSPQ